MAFATGAVAADPLPRQPTGQWVVDYAENMCVLQRDYGTPQSPVTLAFRPKPMGEHLTVYIFDEPARRSPKYVSVKVGFGPGESTVDSKMATFDVRHGRFRFNETGLKREELERAAASEQISFNAGKRLSLALAVPNLSRALNVLDDCVADLLETWGFSRERQQSLAILPQPLKPLNEYISPSDYPGQAIMKGESGANSARFRVDDSGQTSAA